VLKFIFAEKSALPSNRGPNARDLFQTDRMTHHFRIFRVFRPSDDDGIVDSYGGMRSYWVYGENCFQILSNRAGLNIVDHDYIKVSGLSSIFGRRTIGLSNP
jgi:hypothetical protein